MQKLKKKAQEASALAADRSSKCTVAMKAMKCITDQVIFMLFFIKFFLKDGYVKYQII